MAVSPKRVVAWRSWAASYPAQAPFDPGEVYPECGGDRAAEPNPVFEGVRQCFQMAGLDAARRGTAEWNPLADLMAPGETVLLKPNWVKAEHPRLEQAGQPEAWQCVVTHPSVIRAVADYCFKAVGGSGRVVVADAPQTDSSWELLEQRLELEALRRHYRARGRRFEIVDLRKEEWTAREGVIVERRSLAGDPAGYVAVDLGRQSEFATHAGSGRYYGADYDEGEVNRHHSGGRHEYLVSRTALEADVVFSLPKLKTHKKTGLTAGLKNLVGVNGDKNWLPHHTEPAWTGRGGDERPCPAGGWTRPARVVERQVARLLRKASLSIPGLADRLHRPARRVGTRLFGHSEEVIRSGNWWGNDTCWRMCLDLNKIVLYARPDGTLRPGGPAGRRRYFVLADGLVAGHRSGPMNPDPIGAGVLLFGTHPASVDALAAILMGFDPERVPLVRRAFAGARLPLAEWDWRQIEAISNEPDWCGRLDGIDSEATLGFEPHFGWLGQIERAARPRVA